jgi:hypothetical protein
MDKQNFEEWEAEQEEYERLFHKGKLLHAEINALDADDILIIDDFLDHLSPDEEKAFKLYDEYLFEKNKDVVEPVADVSTEVSNQKFTNEKLSTLLDKFIDNRG